MKTSNIISPPHSASSETVTLLRRLMLLAPTHIVFFPGHGRSKILRINLNRCLLSYARERQRHKALHLPTLLVVFFLHLICWDGSSTSSSVCVKFCKQYQMSPMVLSSACLHSRNFSMQLFLAARTLRNSSLALQPSNLTSCTRAAAAA